MVKLWGKYPIERYAKSVWMAFSNPIVLSVPSIRMTTKRARESTVHMWKRSNYWWYDECVGRGRCCCAWRGTQHRVSLYSMPSLCVLICLVAFERDWKSCFRMHLQSVQSHLLVALQTHADTSWFELLPKWETIFTCKHSIFPLRKRISPILLVQLTALSRQSEIERIQWASEVWATPIYSYLIVLTDFTKLL